MKMKKIKSVLLVHILKRIKNERIENEKKIKNRKIEPVLLVGISENLTLWTAQIYAGLQAESTNNMKLSLSFLPQTNKRYIPA